MGVAKLHKNKGMNLLETTVFGRFFLVFFTKNAACASELQKRDCFFVRNPL